jgi:hypothetical protein
MPALPNIMLMFIHKSVIPVFFRNLSVPSSLAPITGVTVRHRLFFHIPPSCPGPPLLSLTNSDIAMVVARCGLLWPLLSIL